nr:hypothetical protein [Tanacetum cinerariifolium]
DDDELDNQVLEAHYIYMAQLQEVSPDVVDSGPIFDVEPLQKLVVIRLRNSECRCHKVCDIRQFLALDSS